MKSIDIGSLGSDEAFKLRLQIALRYQAVKIRAVSDQPEKFDEYISQRVAAIEKMVGKNVSVTEGFKHASLNRASSSEKEKGIRESLEVMNRTGSFWFL